MRLLLCSLLLISGALGDSLEGKEYCVWQGLFYCSFFSLQRSHSITTTHYLSRIARDRSAMMVPEV